MSRKPSAGKTIAWAYSAVLTFATAFIVGGILLDKKAKKEQETERRG
ncbi:MAG: hypothetical protein NVS2B12_01090 [Ktedonobacteraceae bacterium]